MKLSTKSVIMLFSVLLATLSFTGWLHIQKERHVLIELMQKHGKSLSHSIAVFCIEILLSEDYPILDTFLETLGKEKKEIIFIEVIHQGKVVSKYIAASEGISDSVIFSSDVLFSVGPNKSSEKVGEVKLGLSDRENKLIMAARLRGLIIVVVSLFIILVLLETLLINRIVIRPIRKLVEGIQRVARGEMTNPVEIKSRDEIGDLAASFNKMIKDLQKITVSRDYMNNIFSSMTDSLIVLTANGRIRTINQATLDILGYTEDELLNQFIGKIFAEEEEEEEEWFRKSGITELINKGSIRNVEKTYLAKDGRKIHVLFSGSVMRAPLDSEQRKTSGLLQDKRLMGQDNAQTSDVGKIQGIVCIAQDITERKHAEEEIKRSEERYRTLVQAIPDIVYKIDEDGYFTFINNSVRALGYEPEELIGKHFSEILHPDDVESINSFVILRKYTGKITGDEKAPKLFDERRTGRRMTRNLEVRLAPKHQERIKSDKKEIIGLITAYGEVFAAGDYGAGVNGKDREFLGTVGIIRDITEKLKMQSEAIRASQMAILGELAASVAHEINTPINAISNCAQLLLEESDSGKEDYKIINGIIIESSRIAKVVKNLLSFSRDKEEDKDYFSAYDLLSGTLTLTLTQMQNEGIQIISDLSSDLPGIFVHPQRIQQVFFNIINNAQYTLNEKYPETHGNKIIKISGESITIDGCPFIQITFYDKGQGISADKIDRIMKPFFTTKPRGQGTGLGLSICHKIIDDHGGKIEIDSVEGEYTKFIIKLPVARKR